MVASAVMESKCVAITGGCGFLGAALARRIATDGVTLPNGHHLSSPQIVLLDRPGVHDPCITGSRYVPCDITDSSALRAAIPQATALVYHLAAVVSGQAEADFELGLKVNFDGARALLSVLREKCAGIPVIATSSLAVFGADATTPITERSATQPTSSYGASKAMTELLFADFRRRGWLDARILRLPTIAVRPGTPNAAASSFISSIIREPLAGKAANCPIAPSFPLWIASPSAAIASLMRAAAVDAALWPRFGALNAPGIVTSAAEMLEALRRLDAHAASRVSFQREPRIEAIIYGWPSNFDCATAKKLGFEQTDVSADDLVAQAMAARSG